MVIKRQHQLSLALTIPEDLLNIEKEKLELEKKNSSIKNKISVFSALSAILASLITFGATYMLKTSGTKESKIIPPRIHTHLQKMAVSEDDCIDSLKGNFINYGLSNITSVKNGIYGIKEEYNIFASCNAQSKSILLVVGGPNDTEAKEIRSRIISSLP